VLPREKISVMELESRPDCADIQDYLMSITGGRSVPRVFVAGKFIGGGDDTEALARSGKLKEMLEQNDII
jgi:glutaredoxin 3